MFDSWLTGLVARSNQKHMPCCLSTTICEGRDNDWSLADMHWTTAWGVPTSSKQCNAKQNAEIIYLPWLCHDNQLVFASCSLSSHSIFLDGVCCHPPVLKNRAAQRQNAYLLVDLYGTLVFWFFWATMNSSQDFPLSGTVLWCDFSIKILRSYELQCQVWSFPVKAPMNSTEWL